MPRPARPWFRFYSEATESLKVHALPDRLVKPWLFMLCLANVNNPRGRLPSVQKVAFTLRVKEDKAMALIDELTNRRFIDQDRGHYVMHEWDEFQADRDIPAGKRGDASRVERANDADSTRKSHDRIRVRVEKEVEVEKEKEVEVDRAGRDEPPPTHPFAVLYSQKHRERTGKILTPAVHGRALSLEQQYGAELCIQVAEEKGWENNPSYYVGALEDRENGNRNRKGRDQSAASTDTRGMATGVSDLERRRAALAERGRASGP